MQFVTNGNKLLLIGSCLTPLVIVTEQPQIASAFLQISADENRWRIQQFWEEKRHC